MPKKIETEGSILGVDFKLRLEEDPTDPQRVAVKGSVLWKGVKLPIDIVMSMRDEYFTAGGTLLGAPFNLRGSDE